TIEQRATEVKGLEQRIASLDRELSRRLPSLPRSAKLATATVADLQKALPADAALIDYVHYVFFQRDVRQPPGKQRVWTRRYLAFVVTRERVRWVDLDTALAIDTAVNAWREGMGDPTRKVPAASAEKVAQLAKEVGERVWARVRKELPASVKTVYVCPDA